MTPRKKDPKTKAVKASSKTNKPQTPKTLKKTASPKTNKQRTPKNLKTTSPKINEQQTPKTLKKTSPKSNEQQTPKTLKKTTPKTNKQQTPKTLKKKSPKTKPVTSKTLKKTTPKNLSKSKRSLRERAVQCNTVKILKARKPKLLKKEIKSSRGVVFLSNIPHGFYETEMRKFFSQFGQVTGVRVPRSTRTGKYKSYAFIEFMYPDVAKIAAETMNNYLMYKRIVKAKYIPAEEQKPHAFKFPSFKVPLTVRRKQFLRQQSNLVLTEEQSEKKKKRLDDCVQKKLNKLKKLGINYEFQVANRESLTSKETTA